MIPQQQTRGQASPDTASWQQALSDLVTDPRELLEFLELDPSLLPAALLADRDFRLRVPRAFLGRMRRGDPDDPLLRQVLPTGAEAGVIPGYSSDPLAEHRHTRAAGLLQKYQGRVLVIAAGACAVNCRYCFRRHYPYGDNTPGTEQWQHLLATVADDTSIEEVILSGGDPLMVSNRRLSWIANELAAIPHVTRLRVHTRLPVVIPARVDDSLPSILAGTRLAAVLVIHANHANELDEDVRQAMARLADAGITLLNQSVLLRGVNDSANALADLSHRLLACRVMPYYLHLLDRVAGAAHFDVPETEATALLRDLAGRLPGYLLPRLVREIPGQPGKTPIPFAGQPEANKQ